jgi:aspartate racemase
MKQTRKVNRKIVGVLGGMGPEATASLFQKIIEATPAKTDQDHIHVIIDSNPKIPSRQAAIEGKGESPLPAMIESGNRLTRAGAHFIVVPCVTAHYFFTPLREKLAVPVLSILEETEAYLRGNYPVIRAVGLLATRAIITTSLIQEALLKVPVRTFVPVMEDQKLVQQSIAEIKNVRDADRRKSIRNDLLNVASRLIEEGAEGIIAGCTEIPLVLCAQDLPVPLLDTLQILAAAAVREVFGNSGA